VLRYHVAVPQKRLEDVDYSDPALVVFVTIRAHPGTSPFRDERVARAVVREPDMMRTRHRVSLYAYCLMPDHLHLLLRMGDSGRPLGTVIGAMKSFTTRQYWSLGYRGVLWQERFHDHVVRRYEAVQTIGAYILANPERKGLVERAHEWPWSGTPDPL